MVRSLSEAFKAFSKTTQKLTVLTGAGVSAESGIPTFRGPEGYWTVGSQVYHPQEMATFRMFRQQPEEVWSWYLYRRAICAQAQPNAGHHALVALERQWGKRFHLITQNVDGLHVRAGHQAESVFEIHGNLNLMRCFRECQARLEPIPFAPTSRTKTQKLKAEEQLALCCSRCGEPTRPHVLWFDESYNEEYYRFESAMEVASQTGFLLVVGTSGATSLPNYIVTQVLEQGGTVLDVNLEKNRFGEMALQSGQGYVMRQPSSQALPEFLRLISEVM